METAKNAGPIDGDVLCHGQIRYMSSTQRTSEPFLCPKLKVTRILVYKLVQSPQV